MKVEELEFRESKEIDLDKLRLFFMEEEWNDFFELDELRTFVQSSLYFVSVWDKDLLVGIGRLSGEERIQIEITDVVVKSTYQNRGIGTGIVSRMVSFIDITDPYFVQVAPIGEREVHLYEKFGFKVMPEYIRMQRSNGKLREKISAVRNR